MKVIAIILFFQLWINKVSAQHDYNYRINLQTDCSICRLNYARGLKIDLTRMEDKMTIAYRVLDSIQTIKLYNDPDFLRTKSLMMEQTSQIPDSVFLSEFRNQLVKHSVFFTDTLVLDKSDNPELFDYVDLFGEMNDAFTTEITAPETSIILDGNYFWINIQSQNGATGKYCVHVLNESRYPMTYKLVESLLGVYRTMKPGTLLDKGTKTLDY